MHESIVYDVSWSDKKGFFFPFKLQPQMINSKRNINLGQHTHVTLPITFDKTVAPKLITRNGVS